VLASARAYGAFEVTGASLTPSSLAAGSHPDVAVQTSFTPYASSATPHVRDLVVHLPPGLIGDPNATARCTAADFAADSCPAATSVGSVSAQATAVIGFLPTQLTAPGNVYNLEPQAGEPARLGTVVRPLGGLLGKLFVPVSVRVRSSDGGLDTVITNLPSQLNGIDTWLESLTLTLAGTAAGAPFMTLPTGCVPAAATVDATASDNTTASRTTTPFTPTSCDQLPFAPRIGATVGAVGQTRIKDKPPVTTVITSPPGQAAIRTAVVTLPSDVTVDIATLGQICTGADLSSGNCPPGSQVGTAEARTSLLSAPLTGDVVLARAESAGLPGLTVFLRSPVALRLDGSFDLNTRRATFDNIPDVPLSRFELHFVPNRLLQLFKDLCAQAPVTIDAQFTGHNGRPASDREAVQRAGCAPTPGASLKLGRLAAAHPTLALNARPGTGGAGLRTLRLELTSSLRAHRGRGRLRASADGRRISPKAVRLSSAGVLTVALPSGGAKLVTVTLRGGAFSATRALKRRLRKRPPLTFALEVTDRDGNRAASTLRVRARR
jgi:hypothetical protein